MIKTLFSLGILALVIAAFSGGASRADAAPPKDGVYHIAVLDLPGCCGWDDEDLTGLEDAPGVFDYEWDFLDPEDIVSDLDDFDVLIIPYQHDYDWLDDNMIDAIVEWVWNGGTLLIHPINNDGEGVDPILDAFGSKYSVNRNSEGGDTVTIIAASNPLVTTPNKLSAAGLSNWGSSYHSVVVSAGSAWKWALSSPDGLIAGCTSYGEGAIVVQGLDPESHHSSGNLTFEMLENEVTINRSGICAGEDEEEEEPSIPGVDGGRFLGGGLVGGMATQASAQARANRERANAAGAAAAAAPASTPAAAVRPPSTGDAGLMDTNTGLGATTLLAGLLTATLFAGLRLRRQR